MQAPLVVQEHLSIKLLALKLPIPPQPVVRNAQELFNQLHTLFQLVELNVRDL